MSATALFDVITVHCFRCAHTEVGASPDAAHGQMEAHYSDKHAAFIASIAGPAQGGKV